MKCKYCDATLQEPPKKLDVSWPVITTNPNAIKYTSICRNCGAGYLWVERKDNPGIEAWSDWDEPGTFSLNPDYFYADEGTEDK